MKSLWHSFGGQSCNALPTLLPDLHSNPQLPGHPVRSPSPVPLSQLLLGAGRQGMLLHQSTPCFLGEGGSWGTEPRSPETPVPSMLPSLGLCRRPQQVAPGHRSSYKLFGRVDKRANPCSHRTGFVPSPEPSLTINRGWDSSKVCSICCSLSGRSSPFRIQESIRKAQIFVNTIMVILIDQ